MLMNKIRAGVTAAIIGLTGSMSSAATLDQEFVPQITGGINAGVGLVAQTFEAGITGTLSSISAHIVNFDGSTEDFTLSLYTTSGGIPGTNLGGVTLTSADFPTMPFVTGTSNFTSFDFSGLGLSITAGTSYAIVSSTPETENRYSWRSSTNGPTDYANGQRYVSSDGGATWLGDPNWDFAFQTFVVPIPVPASFPLLGFAILCFGVMRRRKMRISA